MNHGGGDPGHDEYGLPEVDIEIPDDARELDPDVQAYYRELRALRRHERSRRWRAPLRRTSAVMPVIVGFLVLAMLAGMVLTMFSASPYFAGLPGRPPGQGPPAASGGRARAPVAWQRASRLPRATITVHGRPVQLATLTTAVVALVPRRCGCRPAVAALLSQARAAGVLVYLVGAGASRTEIVRLAGEPRRGAVLATDPQSALAAAYRPSGLTVLLVDSRGAVTVRAGLTAGARLAQRLRSLRPAG